MNPPTLTVSRRPAGEKASLLRRRGTVPGILYGHRVGNVSLACDEKILEKVLRSAGESTIIELHLEKTSVPVLVHEVQRHPVNSRISHVDFYALDLSKKVRTSVPTVAVGLSLAVKDLGGILVHQMQAVKVECLPKDLPASIEVDISGLANFHDKVTVASLHVDPAVKVLEDKEETVFTVVPPREEEKEEEKPVVAVEGVTPEGETVVAAEGAAPAEAEATKPTSAPAGATAGKKGGAKEKPDKK